MTEPLLQRLGLVGRAADGRLCGLLLASALLLYSVGFASFYPSAVVNTDEDLYIEQTLVWLETGSLHASKQDPLTGAIESVIPGNYPMGMVALFSPFVAGFGWRGAFIPAFLAVLVAVLATAKWLQQERRSPIFALLLLGFPAVLVMGRMATSDTARIAATALGLWFFFRGLDREPRGWWLASGFVAGASLALRENTVLPFIPFFLGSVLRWDRGWGWLLLGGLLGVALHLTGNTIAFGDPLFVRGQQGFYPFEIEHIPERLTLYLIGLLVFVPAGLLFGLAYRGRRRPELLATIVSFFLFFLFQAYGASESGFVKSLVLGLRYFGSLLPVLAFAMAESVPRWLDSERGARNVRIEALVRSLSLLWLAGILVACFAVHPVLDRWAGSQAEIRGALERHVPRETVLVTNYNALRKFVPDLSRPYRTLDRRELTPESLHELGLRHELYFVALLDRSDSDYWRADIEANAAFVAQLPASASLVLDLKATPTDRLRIWRVAEGSETTVR